MTPATETSTAQSTREHGHLPFHAIDTPGCYVSRNTGDLYRIPAEALALRQSPVIEIVSRAGLRMTRIAEDPWIPLNKARQLCADADLYHNF
jgi:hypothetical protein